MWSMATMPPSEALGLDPRLPQWREAAASLLTSYRRGDRIPDLPP